MKDFEITFLGTGTSVGVPVIGCDCAVCTSDDPKNKRSRSSIHIDTPEAAWVVDTGPDFREQCLREGIRALDAAIFTHAHTDHIMGFDDLRRFSLGRDAALPIYATAETMGKIRAAFGFAFDGKNRYPGYLKPDPREVDGAPFQLGATRISTLPVVHGKVETVGFLFEHKREEAGSGHTLKVAYLPDCKTVSPEAVDRMRDLEVLIIDGLRHTPHVTHMNIEEATAFAEDLGTPHVWLTHLSCEVDHEAAERALPDHIHLAYDGLKLAL